MGSWATAHIARLQAGETVQFRPHGNSMTPRIKSGQLCTVAPLKAEDLERLDPGTIVLCKVNGKQFLHLLSAKRGKQAQISNNHGHVNGWTRFDHVYGYLVSVED